MFKTKRLMNVDSGCAVSSVVEHYLDTIKRLILAIFSSLYFPFATIEKPLMLLDKSNVSMSSLAISKNLEFLIRVTSRVQVLVWKTSKNMNGIVQILTPRMWF